MPLRLRILAAVAFAAVAAAMPVRAQEAPANTAIGPPQLRDFSIVPQRRIVEQPRPQPQRTETAAQPARPAASTPARTARAVP
ncbi:MAG: hypothetical protein ACT4OE_04365, partial [Sphingosinicella sp.]